MTLTHLTEAARSTFCKGEPYRVDALLKALAALARAAKGDDR